MINNADQFWAHVLDIEAAIWGGKRLPSNLELEFKDKVMAHLRGKGGMGYIVMHDDLVRISKEVRKSK